MFSNFVQNFDELIKEIKFQGGEYVRVYLKMINYLEKHLIYKKLYKKFIIKCLMGVREEEAKSQEVDILVLKLLKFNDVSQESYVLISQSSPIKHNKFYPFVQLLLLGDYQQFTKSNKETLLSSDISIPQLQRKVKIQAIPRILTGIKTANYSQISQILKINKEQVQSYIIQAIQYGLLKAKIDQYQQTIIINLRFGIIRSQERAMLQKNISVLVEKLERISVQ